MKSVHSLSKAGISSHGGIRGGVSVFLWLFLSYTLACAFFVLPAKGAQLPFLQGPLVYSGEYKTAGKTRRVFLYLSEEHSFLLWEKMAGSAGEVTVWECSGSWHQIRNGAFIQLSNDSFRRLLAVGGSSVLYLGMQIPDEKSGSKQMVVPLRPQNSALHAKEIRSIPPKEREPGYSPGYFLDAVAGSLWKITRIGRDVPMGAPVVSFSPDKGAYSGKLEIFDGHQHASGTFSLDGERLLLVPEIQGELFVRLAEQTQFWQLTGDVLELWDDKQIVALLERAR